MELLKQKHTSKPSNFVEVDFTQDITRDLKAAYLMNDSLFSSTRKFNGIESAVTPTVLHPEHGKGKKFETSQHIDLGIVIGQRTDITYFVIASSRQLDQGNNDILVGYGDRATIRLETGGARFFTWSASGWQTVNSTVPLTVDVAYKFMAVHDGSNNDIYVGTEKDTLAVNQRDSSGSIDRNLYIGSDDETSGRFLDGNVYLCYVWERALSETERLAVINNPYALLKPRNLYLPSVAVGGEGIQVLRRRMIMRQAA